MVWDVESAEWVRGLSNDEILAATDEGSFERGLDYAERGMVQQVATLNRGRVVVAKVAGSGRDSYQTIVSLHSDPKDAVVEWGARCSCPVARDCKHAVAVVVSVRDVLGGSADGVEPPAPSRPWEDALASLTVEPPRESLDQGVPVALVVERVEAPAHTWGRERVPRVRVRPTRRTKAGHWAKKYSWSELLQSDHFTAAGVRESHRRALTTFYTLHEARTGARRYSYGSGGDVHLDVLGPDVWSALRRVGDAGVALIGSEAGDEVELVDEAVEVAIDVTAVDEGLVLRPTITGAGPDAIDMQTIGDPLTASSGSTWVPKGVRCGWLTSPPRSCPRWVSCSPAARSSCPRPTSSASSPSISRGCASGSRSSPPTTASTCRCPSRRGCTSACAVMVVGCASTWASPTPPESAPMSSAPTSGAPSLVTVGPRTPCSRGWSRLPTCPAR